MSELNLTPKWYLKNLEYNGEEPQIGSLTMFGIRTLNGSWIDAKGVERLKSLDISGFKSGETILYCTECAWQTHEHVGMSPYCPDCKAPLSYVKLP